MHLTTHYSLAEACRQVTRERVLRQLRLTHRSFETWGWGRPAIAVAALNPHGGEGGLLGREEIEAIAPAIADAQAEGIDARGPLPADSLFAQAVDDVVKADGPNGLTRASLLRALGAIHRFTDNGWVGEIDPRGATGCFVVMQIKGGVFKRVYPEQRGTLDCRAENKVTYKKGLTVAKPNVSGGGADNSAVQVK